MWRLPIRGLHMRLLAIGMYMLAVDWFAFEQVTATRHKVPVHLCTCYTS